MSKYVEAGCHCCNGVCDCACHWPEEDTITSDTEIDDEEVQCSKCKRTVNLYGEEIYHEYQDGGHYLVWICNRCFRKE
jgi:hypothetical protein